MIRTYLWLYAFAINGSGFSRWACPYSTEARIFDLIDSSSLVKAFLCTSQHRPCALGSRFRVRPLRYLLSWYSRLRPLAQSWATSQSHSNPSFYWLEPVRCQDAPPRQAWCRSLICADHPSCLTSAIALFFKALIRFSPSFPFHLIFGFSSHLPGFLVCFRASSRVLVPSARVPKWHSQTVILGLKACC